MKERQIAISWSSNLRMDAIAHERPLLESHGLMFVEEEISSQLSVQVLPWL